MKPYGKYTQKYAKIKHEQNSDSKLKLAKPFKYKSKTPWL